MRKKLLFTPCQSSGKEKHFRIIDWYLYRERGGIMTGIIEEETKEGQSAFQFVVKNIRVSA